MGSSRPEEGKSILVKSFIDNQRTDTLFDNVVNKTKVVIVLFGGALEVLADVYTEPSYAKLG